MAKEKTERASVPVRLRPPSEEGVDALSKEFYRARKKEMAARVNERRMRHIVGVAKTSAKIARAYGLNVRAAKLAGLLHDWDKCYDDEDIRARAAEVGLDVEQEVLDIMPYVLHGMTAALALKAEYPSIPSDVLQAIYRHTTAATDMTELDMVVYIADCLEPSRKFQRTNELVELVGKVPLEELFFRVHALWLQLIIERWRPVHPQTAEVWNHYAYRHRERADASALAAGKPSRSINPCAVDDGKKRKRIQKGKGTKKQKGK